MKKPVSNQGPLMLIGSATKQNISQVLSYWINRDVYFLKKFKICTVTAHKDYLHVLKHEI